MLHDPAWAQENNSPGGLSDTRQPLICASILGAPAPYSVAPDASIVRAAGFSHLWREGWKHIAGFVLAPGLNQMRFGIHGLTRFSGRIPASKLSCSLGWTPFLRSGAGKS